MKVGIVGMPNAGKSTLFNALTRAGADAAGYPFTTIEPNVAIAPVPDERLDSLAATVEATPVVHETLGSTTSPGSSAAPMPAKASATSSSPRSARPTRSATSSAPTPTAASPIPTAASIPSPMPRWSRPS